MSEEFNHCFVCCLEFGVKVLHADCLNRYIEVTGIPEEEACPFKCDADVCDAAQNSLLSLATNTQQTQDQPAPLPAQVADVSTIIIDADAETQSQAGGLERELAHLIEGHAVVEEAAPETSESQQLVQPEEQQQERYDDESPLVCD